MNGSNYVDQEGRMMRAVVHREYFEGSVECESKWAHVWETDRNKKPIEIVLERENKHLKSIATLRIGKKKQIGEQTWHYVTGWMWRSGLREEGRWNRTPWPRE